MPFYKYRTDQGNTIIAVSETSFVLGANEAQIASAVILPSVQSPYLWRVSGTDIVENPDSTINTYLKSTGVDPTPPLQTSTFTGYTATTAPRTYQSKASIFTLTGTTLPFTYQSKASVVTLTGSTLPLTYQSKASMVVFTGTTLPASYYNKTQINAFTATTINSVNNGLVKLGTTAKLGGNLIGATTITSTGTTSRLSFGGFPLQYAGDYSANVNIRSIPDWDHVTGWTQMYKYNAGAAPTLVTASRTWVAQATTDSNSIVTVYPTNNGAVGGTALFTTIYSITATAQENTTSANDAPIASIRSISADRRTLIVQALESNTIAIGGQGLTFAGSGVVINIIITGV